MDLVLGTRGRVLLIGELLEPDVESEAVLV